MSSRDTVRAFREGALATQQRPSLPPGLMRTVSIVVGVGLIAFAAVFAVTGYMPRILMLPGTTRIEALPVNEDIPTFSQVQSRLKLPNGAPASGSSSPKVATADPVTPLASSDAPLLANGVKAFSAADRQACVTYAASVKKREKAAQQASEAGDGNPFGSGAGAADLGPTSAMLTCVAQTRPLRLCDANERASFVALANIYVGQYDNLTGTLRGGLEAIDREKPEIHPMPGQIALPDVLKSGLRNADAIHTRVGTIMRDLVQKGLLSEGDFGGFMGMGVPATIHAMLSGVGPAKSVCS